MEFLTILAIAVGIGIAVVAIIAHFNRCPNCQSLIHAFSNKKEADLDAGIAYVICKKCGHREKKGEVASDGTVIWSDGTSGHFHKDGSYVGDGGDGGFGGDGGGDGGGGGE